MLVARSMSRRTASPTADDSKVEFSVMNLSAASRNRGHSARVAARTARVWAAGASAMAGAPRSGSRAVWPPGGAFKSPPGRRR